MNVKIEEVEKNKVKIEIEVDADVLEEGLDRSFRRSAKRFSIPGFRKGRAPRAMVERYYGVESLYEGVVDILCPEIYEKALKENDVEPVDSPELDIVELERGKPFIFTATVVVKPEVALGDYIGVEAAYKTVIVTEDEIEAELKSNADKNSRLIPVEDRPAQKGDTVIMDFEGFIDGVPFEGGKGEGYSLELGSGMFIPGFEEQLEGTPAGGFTKVSVRFPDDYNSDDLKGKDAEFNVTVHSIKVKELPEIDDDFAQDVSEFETLDEYKADVRRQLTERQEERAKQDFQNELIKKIVDGAQADIPEPMIKRQIERNIGDLEMSMTYQGLNLEKYFEMTRSNRAELEDSFRERSVSEIKTRLVIERIGKEKELVTTDEEFDGEIRRRADIYKKSFDEYKEQLTDDLASYIRSKLTTDKIIAYLVENAKRINS